MNKDCQHSLHPIKGSNGDYSAVCLNCGDGFPISKETFDLWTATMSLSSLLWGQLSNSIGDHKVDLGI